MPDPMAGLPPRLLRTPDAARFLGISNRTLEKHRTYGTGPVYRKIGRPRRLCGRGPASMVRDRRAQVDNGPDGAARFPGPPIDRGRTRGARRMTLSVEQERRRAPRQSERTRLDPFVVIGGDASPRDQRDLMEWPFFSLSKSPRTKPILYRANDVEVQVFGMPNHGMATIWDADVLIWAASQIVRAENLGLATSRFFRFTPYQLLRGVGRRPAISNVSS